MQQKDEDEELGATKRNDKNSLNALFAELDKKCQLAARVGPARLGLGMLLDTQDVFILIT